MKIGIIAEEQNDVDVLYELTCKLINENSFSFKKFLGHGCGKIHSKCSAWADNLLKRGCSHLIVVHDLDFRIETTLRSVIESYINDINFDRFIILIPVREIEAWLLTDPHALKKVFDMSKLPKLPSNPQILDDPKKRLRNIVYTHSSNRYLNTIHNQKIASKMSIANAKKCSSFRPYCNFIKKCL